MYICIIYIYIYICIYIIYYIYIYIGYILGISIICKRYIYIRRPRQTQGGARQGIILLILVSDYYRCRGFRRDVRHFLGSILALFRPSGPLCFPVREGAFSALFRTTTAAGAAAAAGEVKQRQASLAAPAAGAAAAAVAAAARQHQHQPAAAAAAAVQ